MISDITLAAPGMNDRVAILAQFANILEGEFWLIQQTSARTRRAHRFDVRHLTTTIGITSIKELRRGDRRTVIAWERMMGRPNAP